MSADGQCPVGIADLLYREARLLDERSFEEWLTLFTKDGTYRIPYQRGDDPHRDPSMLFDEPELRAQRVFRLMDTRTYSQIPPSLTVHAVSNIEVLQAGDDECEVAAVLVVHEVRAGDHRQSGLGAQQTWPACVRYRLRRVEGRWLIEDKTVHLANRDLPVTNLSIIL